jgi:L-seryl-tRNA(Ser) seleniumtransferase
VSDLRSIPGVDRLLGDLSETRLPQPVVTRVVRSCLDTIRAEATIPAYEDILARVAASLNRIARTRLQTVINGTGIINHTNLGRAPLGVDQCAALAEIAHQYNNLEFDLNTGKRGGRVVYLEGALAQVTGGDAATVVNNCAAALVLILKTFALGKEVIVSRGELVQIGGGFRIPDILESSGARLKEVGATNRTSLEDYANAIGPDTGLLLKVHRSNFDMTGFVAAPTTGELARLADAHGIPFAEDLGSGALVPLEKRAPIAHEPTAQEVLKQGCHLMCMSGDKLLGGPQAGIISGRKDLVAAVKKNPFFRALRCDKLILATLQATVDAYLSGDADEKTPVLALMSLPLETLQERAVRIQEAVASEGLRLGHGMSKIGGGAVPSAEIPSVTLELVIAGMKAAAIGDRLRENSPAIIGYVESNCFKLDLRTIFPGQDAVLIRQLTDLFACEPS